MPRFTHPLEIPRSEELTGFKWTGPRAPCTEEGIHGDTHPMTWAADDETYMSAGDPNFAVISGKRRHVPWKEGIANPDLYPHMGGVDFERLTGRGAGFGVEQINTMPGLMGPGGLGPKPTGLISIRGSLYLAVQTLLGWKPSRNREKCQHGSDASIMRSDDFGRTWHPDIGSIFADLEARSFDREGWKWVNSPGERISWRG